MNRFKFAMVVGFSFALLNCGKSIESGSSEFQNVPPTTGPTLCLQGSPVSDSFTQPENLVQTEIPVESHDVSQVTSVVVDGKAKPFQFNSDRNIVALAPQDAGSPGSAIQIQTCVSGGPGGSGEPGPGPGCTGKDCTKSCPKHTHKPHSKPGHGKD